MSSDYTYEILSEHSLEYVLNDPFVIKLSYLQNWVCIKANTTYIALPTKLKNQY